MTNKTITLAFYSAAHTTFDYSYMDGYRPVFVQDKTSLYLCKDLESGKDVLATACITIDAAESISKAIKKHLKYAPDSVLLSKNAEKIKEVPVLKASLGQ